MATALQIVQRFYPDVTAVKDSRASIKVVVTKKDAHSYEETQGGWGHHLRQDSLSHQGN